MRAPVIVDCTLRDGIQSPGLAISEKDRIGLARLLDGIGIQEIEIGAAGADDTAIREILNLQLKGRMLVWSRAREEDMERALNLGATSLYLSLPVSAIQIEKKLRKKPSFIIQSFSNILTSLPGHCYAAAGLEDATRADPEFLSELICVLAESGVRRIRLADTVGILTPERSARFFRRYRRLLNRMQRQNIALEAHMHNDFGLACSNTIAAWRAGAEFINTTLLGAGERAGNAPFEDTVLCLERLYETRTGIRLGDLQPLIEFLVTSAKIDLPLWKSGVGRYAFSHASGLHVDGVFKDPATYEPYPPETIGRSRELIIGRLTGRAALKGYAASKNIFLSDSEVDMILPEVRAHEIVTDAGLLRIVDACRSRQE